MASFSYPNQTNVRRVNFTQEEKMLLLSLVEKNKSWIVDGCMDGSTSWRKKSDVWKEITSDFNLISDNYYQRDMRQLRKCWENLKTRYRKYNRQAPSNESLSLTENDDSLDVDDNSENNLLFKRIGLLVKNSDNRNGSFMPMDKRFGDNQSEMQESMNSLVFGDHSEHFTMVSRAEHHVNDSNSTATTSMVMEVVEKKEDSLDGSQTQAMNQGLTNNLNSAEDDDVSIVEVSSGNEAPDRVPPNITPIQGPIGGRHAFKKVEKSRMNSLDPSAFVHPSITTTTPSFTRKRSMLGSSRPLLKNNFKSHNQSQRYRPSPFTKSNLLSQSRPQASDAEKLLRIRYLRNRIREQEMRLRMMQQKMRHERERHDAVMTLIRKKTTHYENQVDRLQDQFNEDSELCDDWLLADS